MTDESFPVSVLVYLGKGSLFEVSNTLDVRASEILKIKYQEDYVFDNVKEIVSLGTLRNCNIHLQHCFSSKT